MESKIYRSQPECIGHAIRLTQQVREEIREGIITTDKDRGEWEESVARIYAVERWTDLEYRGPLIGGPFDTL